MQAQALSEPDDGSAHLRDSNFLEACQSLEGPGPGMGMIDAGPGVIVIKLDAALGQNFGRCLPRAENPFGGQVLKGGDPVFGIRALGIEFFSLGAGLRPAIGQPLFRTL